MQTIVYKGMLKSDALGRYFKDLTDSAYETAFAIYHRRFSTNTNPQWPLAQPMRVLGHNGEINTLQVCPALIWSVSSLRACRSTMARSVLCKRTLFSSVSLLSCLSRSWWY